MATRVNAVFEQRLPVATAVSYTAGARVNGAQTNVTTVTVHSGHAILANDKFLYALTERNIITVIVFTVSSKEDATITFTPAFSFPNDAVLVGIGQDTGGVLQSDGSYSLPNWDASTITMSTDGNGDDTVSSVTVEPDGSAGHYANTVPVWVLGLDSGGRPIQILPDVGASGAAAGGNIDRGTSFPGSPTLGDQFLLTNAAGNDTLYTYMKGNAGNSDYWVEGPSAPDS